MHRILSTRKRWVFGRKKEETYLADPFWMLGEEELEGVEFLWDTLDVVQTINADDDLHAIKTLLELLNPLLDRFLLQVLLYELLSISVSKHE